MQPQDYLPFFQDLALQLYQTTLELPVYAASLAVVVWLLTAIFYSIRISFLKSHLNRAVKAGKEIQVALTAAEQQAAVLKEEALGQQQLREQAEAVKAEFAERLDELSKQLTAGIQTLAANPQLGQQGLTAPEGLATESLWQRYNAATKQISDKLLQERQAIADLEQAMAVETSKAAEKDQQLQAMQLRLDSQSQQLAKLTLAAEEHKNQVAAQQQAAQQQLAELEARYRLQTSELAAAKAQLATASQPAPAIAVQPTVAVKAEPLAVNPEPVAPLTTQTPAPATAQISSAASASVVPPVQPLAAAPVTSAPAAVKAEPAIAPPVVNIAEKPAPEVVKPAVVPAAVKPKPQAVAPGKTKAGGNKLKGFFANAKETFKKMDQKLGSPSDAVVVEAEQPATAAVSAAADLPQAATAVVEQVAAPAAETAVAQPAAAKPAPAKKAGQLGGLLGKFKRK